MSRTKCFLRQTVFNFFLSVSISNLAYAYSDNRLPKVSIEINGKVFLLEVAASTKDRQRGLMYRRSLNENEGMLFIYPSSSNNRIWMKNTLIPLTVIWVDQFSEVLTVKKLAPCDQTICPVFSSHGLSSFIIELNGGAHHISPGDKIPDLLEIVN
jgi:uncharacterized protein